MKQKPLWQALTYFALIILSVVFTIPFYWLVTTSFKTDANISRWPLQIVPNPWTAEHFAKGVHAFPFMLYLTNTLFICVASTVGTVLSSSMVAYGLSKVRWKYRDALFIVILSTMMIPAQVTMIPLFGLFTKLRWVDTYLPLFVPSFFGNAFFIFLLRQFFMSIPTPLIEAAKLDGCSNAQTFRLIVLPLAKPALATVALFTFMGAWNDFMWPLIYLFDESKYTLSIGLNMFMGQYTSDFGQLMAISTLIVIPIIILFFFTQKTFIQGITMTGVKG